MKLRIVTGVLGVLAVGGAATAFMAGAASAAPSAPNDVTITRNASTPTDVTVSWTAVSGATRYNVSVANGSTETVTTVSGGTTSFKLAQSPCLRYRVNVSSRDGAGAGGTSKNVFVDTTLPGGISGLKASSSADKTAVTATWEAPKNLGVKPKSNGTPHQVQYRVELMDKNSVRYPGGHRTVFPALTANVTALTHTFSGLNPANGPFQLAVTPETGGAISGGASSSCPNTKGVLFVGDNTAVVSKLKTTRNPADPSAVTVSWEPPNYAISSEVTGYTVRYAEMVGATDPKVFTTKKVTGTSTALTLDPARKWMIKVNPVTSLGEAGAAITRLSPPTAVEATRPAVTVTRAGTDLKVTLSAKAGAYKPYPRVQIVLKQTGTGEHLYLDDAVMAPGTTELVLKNLPAYSFVVTVNAVTSTGKETIQLSQTAQDLRAV